MGRRAKIGLAEADLHSGHVVGMTPPSWKNTPARNAPKHKRKQFDFRCKMFDWRHKLVKELGKVDFHIINGDAIDGRGKKSGGTELITTDRNEQCDMAAECIRLVKCGTRIMTYGTPYHTGQLEDFENTIAREVKADKIGGHEWLDVNGVVFDIKHKVGGSSIPHGRHTAPAKERITNILLSLHDETPRGDIFIRSHVHYYTYCGDTDFLAMTTPALQGPGSKFGVRQCSNVVNFGVVIFKVNPSGSFTWEPRILRLMQAKAELLKA